MYHTPESKNLDRRAREGNMQGCARAHSTQIKAPASAFTRLGARGTSAEAFTAPGSAPAQSVERGLDASHARGNVLDLNPLLERPQSMWFQGGMPVEAFAGASSAQSASYDQALYSQVSAFSSSFLTAPQREAHVSNLHPATLTLARAQPIGFQVAPAPPQPRQQLYRLVPVEQDSVAKVHATQTSHHIPGAAGDPQGFSYDHQPITIVENWPQSSLMFVGRQNFLSQDQQQRTQGATPLHPLFMGQAPLPFAPGLTAQPAAVGAAYYATPGHSMFVTTQEDDAVKGSTQAGGGIGAATGSAAGLHPGLRFKWSGMSTPQYLGRRKPWKIALTSEQARSIYSQRLLNHDSEYCSLAKALAEKYNVSPKTIRDIWRRETWVKATKSLWTRHELEAWVENESEHRCTQGQGKGRAQKRHRAGAASRSISDNNDTKQDDDDHDSEQGSRRCTPPLPESESTAVPSAHLPDFGDDKSEQRLTPDGLCRPSGVAQCHL
jgi:hypothetical protein